MQLSQAVPYTSPDSFDVNSLATAVTGAANVSGLDSFNWNGKF